MKDQRKFVEMLNEITDIAKINNNSISTAEIDVYFSDMELSETQLEYVYDYISKGGITVIGYVSSVLEQTDTIKEQTRVSDDNQSETDTPSSVRLKHYRKSVRDLAVAEDELLELACAGLLDGSATDRDKHIVIEKHLSTVMNIASKYTGRGVSTDELIEEGNLTLVIAVDELFNGEIIDTGITKNARDICEEYIRNRVRKGIIGCIDDSNEHETALYAMVAKAALVNEAVKALAEENGRIANLEELSQYTHMSVDEIEDIVKLSAGSIEIGKE